MFGGLVDGACRVKIENPAFTGRDGAVAYIDLVFFGCEGERETIIGRKTGVDVRGDGYNRSVRDLEALLWAINKRLVDQNDCPCHPVGANDD